MARSRGGSSRVVRNRPGDECGRCWTAGTPTPVGLCCGFGEQDRLPGFDLTFSAPKGVSLLFALGDERTSLLVREAHDRAVAAALGYLEREAGEVRRGRDGVDRLPGGGFVAAGFRHRSSRAGDPQLHTHVLVANMTRGADGRWSALDGRQLYWQAKTAGTLYQAALRYELRALGLRFVLRDTGLCELADVPRRVLRGVLEAAGGDRGRAGPPRRVLPRRGAGRHPGHPQGQGLRRAGRVAGRGLAGPGRRAGLRCGGPGPAVRPDHAGPAEPGGGCPGHRGAARPGRVDREGGGVRPAGRAARLVRSAARRRPGARGGAARGQLVGQPRGDPRRPVVPAGVPAGGGPVVRPAHHPGHARRRAAGARHGARVPEHRPGRGGPRHGRPRAGRRGMRCCPRSSRPWSGS